jgi:hypothetical protein
MMKRSFDIFMLLMLSLLGVALTSCDDSISDPDQYLTQELLVQLTGDLPAKQGILVRAVDDKGMVFSQPTDASGVATFHVPVGIYDITVSHVSTPDNGWRTVYNGSTSNVVVRQDSPATVSLPLATATSSAIIIRELYVGGCQRDDGSGWFYRDKYVIIANNSPERVVLPALCLAIATPYNSYGDNKNYDDQGHLNYENEGFIPAASSIWYFQGENVVFEPWQQRVIALNGAIDHTLTYANSVNLANPDYYCTYDIEHYTSTSAYPSPSELIPTSHYLKAVRYGDQMESAWPLSNTSPAFFIFTPPEGMTPLEFGNDASNVWYDEGRALPTFACRKVPVENILDAVEVFSTSWDEASKRLTASVDVGAVFMTARHGHSVERRIDEQESKRLGHTVYIDTNNSTLDFYEREHCSLKQQ